MPCPYKYSSESKFGITCLPDTQHNSCMCDGALGAYLACGVYKTHEEFIADNVTYPAMNLRVE